MADFTALHLPEMRNSVLKKTLASLVAVSMLLSALATGCDANRPPPKKNLREMFPSANQKDGPHGGALVDWDGGQHFIEFALNQETGEAVVYVFGPDQETPAPVDSEKLLLYITARRLYAQLLPTPLEGEPEGLSSRFVAKEAAFIQIGDFSGSISGVVDGAPYAAEFNHWSPASSP